MLGTAGLTEVTDKFNIDDLYSCYGYDDRPSLPYVEAIMRETIRWQHSVGSRVPHATARSGIYRGFCIPGGCATVVANTWYAMRDVLCIGTIGCLFLNADGSLTDDDPSRFAFGFGRRICVGRHVADASLWISIVTMLAVVDFLVRKMLTAKI
ncbi:cytochrome P450 [Phlebopus sp. FC_14]|nr:cytochrome P450 [Phlebopus sp. FC_14]